MSRLFLGLTPTLPPTASTGILQHRLQYSASPSLSHGLSNVRNISSHAAAAHAALNVNVDDENEVVDDLSKLPEMRARVRCHIDAVIRCLPPHETAAYRQAVAKDRDLVQSETDPMQFVRYCKYDVLAGAKRLCFYWTERLKLFGPERAFLPLVLTGTGALTPQDLLTLRAGYPSLLPDTTTGHKCFFADRSCKIPDATTDQLLRCWFYIYKVLAENDLSQVDGVHALIVAAMPRSKETDLHLNYACRASALVSRAFPVKVHIHLLSIPQQRKPSLATKLVNATVQVLSQYFDNNATGTNKNATITIYNQPLRCKNKILDDLLDLGMVRKAIPHFYGGEWKREDFFDWCQERMEWEQEVYQDRLLGDPLGMASWKRITLDIASDVLTQIANNNSSKPSSRSIALANRCSSDVATAAAQPTQIALSRNVDDMQDKIQVDEEQLAKQRRMADLIRSRRKRERHRIQFEELKTESSDLVRQNKRLQAEHERLNSLLEEAEQCVARLL
ncbi:hypothetical protein ACA910_002134 [Epithemia clementina (nom. ined.)]